MVELVKMPFRKVIRKANLSYEEVETVLNEMKIISNSNFLIYIAVEEIYKPQ